MELAPHPRSPSHDVLVVLPARHRQRSQPGHGARSRLPPKPPVIIDHAVTLQRCHRMLLIPPFRPFGPLAVKAW